MNDPASKHRRNAPSSAKLSVVTVSDTRTEETDVGGRTVLDLAEAAGHQVVDRQIIPDEPAKMKQVITALAARSDIDAILMTGGTGISSRDQTFETVSSLLTSTLPGYGELFRFLSYRDIGAAAMLSRTIGGLVDQTVLLTMPGSPAAVRLAMGELILPELGHLLHEARR